MNKTVAESIRLVTELKGQFSGKQEIDVVVAPSFVSLHPVEIAIQGSSIQLAAQDLYHETSGAYTGEISPSMLVDVGCKYVLVGHSERRTLFGETNQIANLKVRAALENEITPVLCVGETAAEREAKKTFEVIEIQLREGLRGILDSDALDLVVAYEPVWAIGTGKTATPEQAQDVHAYIMDKLATIFRRDIAQYVRIIYGGSVTAENIRELMRKPAIDGVLVGGASLDARSFAQIANFRE